MKLILLSVLLLLHFVSVSQELDASFTGNKTDFNFYNQLTSGLGYFLLNKENIVITTNLGLIYRNQNEFRYLFRLKIVFYYKNFQFESINHIQPELDYINNYYIILFQTFTYKFSKNIHGKLFYWNFFNSFDIQNKFEYLTIGLSFNLKK